MEGNGGNAVPPNVTTASTRRLPCGGATATLLNPH
jgi:hypothetical protein